MSDEVPIYLIIILAAGIIFFGALALYNFPYYLIIEPTTTDTNFAYAPHFVMFTIRPPSSGEEISISSEITGSEIAYTDNNSQVVFKMDSSIKYNVSVPGCKAVVQIYPTFDDYTVEC